MIDVAIYDVLQANHTLLSTTVPPVRTLTTLDHNYTLLATELTSVSGIERTI